MSDNTSFYDSSDDSSSVYTINTTSSIKTENLINCKYPFLFISNIVEFKVQQKKYSCNKIFELIEEYFKIDLKYTLDKINKNSCYKEKYDILLTAIFSCVSALLIEDIDENLIQKIVNHISDEFESVVDTYYGFKNNNKFYNNYFNICKNKNTRTSKSSVFMDEKTNILDSYLEENTKNIAIESEKSDFQEKNKEQENDIIIDELDTSKYVKNVFTEDKEKKRNDYIPNKNSNLEDIVNKLNDKINNENINNLNVNFTENINTNKNDNKIKSDIKNNKEKKKRGTYKKDEKQEKLVNKIIDKLFSQKINKNIFPDIKEENRNKINLFVKIYNKYENNFLTKDEYNEIVLNYDKSSTRFFIVKSIYEHIVKNKDLYNSDIIFFYHSFDGLRIENIENFIKKLEKRFYEK